MVVFSEWEAEKEGVVLVFPDQIYFFAKERDRTIEVLILNFKRLFGCRIPKRFSGPDARNTFQLIGRICINFDFSFGTFQRYFLFFKHVFRTFAGRNCLKIEEV